MSARQEVIRHKARPSVHLERSDLGMWRVLLLIFIPTSLVTLMYVLAGHLLHEIAPPLLLFFLLALFILFPIQLGVILTASKREYGKYSLQSAFSVHQNLPWWQIVVYGALAWGFAGIMSVTLGPLENRLFAPLVNHLHNVLPPYLDLMNISYIQQYSRSTLLLTCGVFFILNVIVGPIVEELFFRGYLTARLSRFGKAAPLIMTVLFSLYHLWLPFNNLFRIVAFFPAFYLAWEKKNIYIAIVAHCLCNLVAALSFIAAVL